MSLPGWRLELAGSSRTDPHPSTSISTICRCYRARKRPDSPFSRKCQGAGTNYATFFTLKINKSFSAEQRLRGRRIAVASRARGRSPQFPRRLPDAQARRLAPHPPRDLRRSEAARTTVHERPGTPPGHERTTALRSSIEALRRDTLHRDRALSSPTCTTTGIPVVRRSAGYSQDIETKRLIFSVRFLLS